jgi:hypothetical protein
MHLHIFRLGPIENNYKDDEDDDEDDDDREDNNDERYSVTLSPLVLNDDEEVEL